MLALSPVGLGQDVLGPPWDCGSDFSRANVVLNVCPVQCTRWHANNKRGCTCLLFLLWIRAVLHTLKNVELTMLTAAESRLSGNVRLT